jgi:hypothetical protein
LELRLDAEIANKVVIVLTKLKVNNMAAIQYIDINEFMDTLKSNGLLIVSSKNGESDHRAG